MPWDFLKVGKTNHYGDSRREFGNSEINAILTLQFYTRRTQIQQASAKLRNVFVKALLWC